MLSAGGLIYEQTLRRHGCGNLDDDLRFPSMTNFRPLRRRFITMWGIPAAADLLAVRLAEDVKAAGIVGAKTVHFDFLDCIYRRGKNGDWLYSDVFVPPHEEDADLPARMAKSISARL